MQIAFFVSTAVSLAVANAAPADTTVASRIESVGLFKNGLAVVRRVVELPGPGEYAMANLPEPVHGTFWIESDGVVSARSTMREVPATAALPPGGNLQRDLAGRTVTIRLRDSNAPAIKGRVLEFEQEPARHSWNRSYFEANRYGWGMNYPPAGHATASPARFLIIDSEAGQVYVDSTAIASMTVDGPANVPVRRVPALVLHVPGSSDKPLTATISYLSRGMAWVPSYRVDLASSTTMQLGQNAIIRNEMEDIADAEFFLISGFPNVEFANVVSPLSPSTTLANFFNELSQPLNARHGSRREVVSQQAVMYNAADTANSIDFTAIPTGDGVDLHYHSVGRHSLLEGDSLMFTVEQQPAEYERIVEWIVPDTRDEYGRPIDLDQHDQSYDTDPDSPWDAVRFRNPLKRPMTTAPAMVVSNGRFCGQRTLHWTSPGEQNTLHVNKALSIRTVASEVERENSREAAVDVIGYKWVRSTVDGELNVRNQRQEEITLVIRRRFTGEVLEAAFEPSARLLESGVYAVNPRRELVWTLKLKPGDQQKISYSYSVLTRR